jgi:hypothetical protein
MRPLTTKSRGSACVFCLRPALATRRFWSFHDPAVIGRHAGGPSEDFGEIVKPFRLGLQSRLKATREVRDTIGSGKVEPLGELDQSGLCVAAAQPGCDRSCYAGVVTPRKQGGFDFLRVRDGTPAFYPYRSHPQTQRARGARQPGQRSRPRPQGHFRRGSRGARKRPDARAFYTGQSRHDQGGDSLPMHFFEQAPTDLVIRPLCEGRACYDIMTSNKSLFLVERPLAI